MRSYDLLDPKHEIAKMEDLPKVELLDMGPGEVHLKNLSQTPVANEEDVILAPIDIATAHGIRMMILCVCVCVGPGEVVRRRHQSYDC